MKRLIILLTGAIILSTGIAFTQTEEDRTNFLDGEFFLAEEDYSEALSAFRKVYRGEYVENANLNYLIGLCYLKINGQKGNAIEYLEKASTNISSNYIEGSFKEENAPNEAVLLLGNAYRIDENLDKACENYNRYISLLKDNQVYELEFVEQQLENCARAKESISNPVDFNKESIGNLHNSQFNNFNAVRSGAGNRIAYMSQQRFYDAIYFADINNGILENPVNVTPQIQSDGDQYVTSLSYDGNTMFLSKIAIDDADIMTSTYEERRWTKSESIGKPINSRYFESHATLSPDGKKLYFLSNRKESLGGMDIFSSDLLEDGSWAEPVNLGPNINTKLNEDSPFLSSDGKKLYFSSEGHSNIGGYDIFYSELDENNNWSEPIALPYPLNTTDDDIFFFPYNDGMEGLMSKIDPNGMGGEDIYYISIQDKNEITEAVEDQEEDLVAVEETVEVTEAETIEEITPVIDAEVLPSVKYYIKPIFFNFDSYALSESAKSKMLTLKEVMEVFPELKLEISAHTDAIGTESYNQLLSSRRANAVQNHLVEIGIAENRLNLKANGETDPIAINRTPEGTDSYEGRKFNRRVQFRIVSPLSDFIIMEAVKVPENLRIK